MYGGLCRAKMSFTFIIALLSPPLFLRLFCLQQVKDIEIRNIQNYLCEFNVNLVRRCFTLLCCDLE